MEIKYYNKIYNVLEKFPEIKENEIYVSHIGDGEYQFNTFGSAHKDMEKYLSYFMKKYNPTIITQDSMRTNCFFIFSTSGQNEKKFTFPVAYLTIEQIDPEKFETEY